MRSFFRGLMAGVVGVLLFAQCTERVTIDTDNQSPKLMISALINTDTGAQSIFLSKSIRYFGGDAIPRVADAEVWINGELLTPVDTNPGEYRTRGDFFAQAGETYNLRVLYNGREYTSVTVVPHVVETSKLELVNMLSNGRPPFFVRAKGPLTTELRYFGADVFYNERKLSRDLDNYPCGEMPLSFAGLDSFTVDFYTIGNRTTMGENDTIFTCPFDTIRGQVHVLNQAAFEFISGTQAELGGNNPLFNGPPANPPLNIEGGDDVIGCFGSYSVSQMVTAVLPMSIATLETENTFIFTKGVWVDSITRHELRVSNGVATRNGALYFTVTAINPDIRGFDAVGADGTPLQFVMKKYSEFWRADNEQERWQWERK